MPFPVNNVFHWNFLVIRQGKLGAANLNHCVPCRLRGNGSEGSILYVEGDDGFEPEVLDTGDAVNYISPRWQDLSVGGVDAVQSVHISRPDRLGTEQIVGLTHACNDRI